MRQITIQSAVIEEIRIRPNDDNVPVSVLYKLYDDAGRTITTRMEDIPQAAFSEDALTNLLALIEKITSGVGDKELTSKESQDSAIGVV